MPSHVTEIHRCPICNDIVAIVPSGFELTPEDHAQKQSMHDKKHDETRKAVEGP